GRRRTPGCRARRFAAAASGLRRGRYLAERRGPAHRGTGSRKRGRAMLDLEAEANASLVHGDFGPHNTVLPASGGRAVLIDTDHASWADPAIDIAPLL